MREQDKEEIIEMPMPNTLGYNNLPNRNSSSSKLSSPVIGERSDQPLIFIDPPQTSSHPHQHNLYSPSLPPNPLQLPQPHRPRIDPDPRTPPPPPQPQPHTTITTTTSTTTLRYRECLKNHAASMGAHVTDGCGEFMPNGEQGTPESFKCAACECHRNFHRKEPQQDQSQQQHVLNYYYRNKNYSPHHNRNTNIHFPTPHNSSLHHPSGAGPVQPMMLGFGGGPAESSSEGLNMFNPSDGGQVQQPPLSSNKKRFRTKFTQQQKDRMMEFAEKLGWKIQKQDEQELHQFCSQLGIKRQVFKVWMHNSKQAMKKKQV